jgi:uncharacterized damage-inducible protein DinB
MMGMNSQEALTHIRYTGWASRRLLDAARNLNPEDLSKNLSASHESILGTLAHTYFGDAVWYRRIADAQTPMPNPKEVPELAELDRRWRELLVKWESWVAARSDQDLENIVAYQLMDGSSSQQPLKHLLLHLVNHGTLHRGQVMAMLRQVGAKPPATDLIYYFREMAAAAAK